MSHVACTCEQTPSAGDAVGADVGAARSKSLQALFDFGAGRRCRKGSQKLLEFPFNGRCVATRARRSAEFSQHRGGFLICCGGITIGISALEFGPDPIRFHEAHASKPRAAGIIRLLLDVETGVNVLDLESAAGEKVFYLET